MPLTKEQEELYKKTMNEAKSQLETIDEEMEKEIQKAREMLARLQESKRAFRQVYEGAAVLLDVEFEPEEEPQIETAEQMEGQKDKEETKEKG